MPINSQHIKGFAVGLGVSALGFYLYKKNQARVDEFLAKQGIHMASASRDYTSMTIEDLVREKENLEDLIAERELEMKEIGEEKKE